MVSTAITNNTKTNYMRLLNVGCGGQRDQEEHWWNLDNLRTQLKEGTAERLNLDREPRYIECDLLTQSIPFHDGFFDGILVQHVLEHFTCHDAVDVLVRCRRVLKPGGILVASVPNTEYFMSVYNKDTKARAVELFGEPIHDDGHDTFFSYALFRHDHKQILTLSSLKALLLRSGFPHINLNVMHPNHVPVSNVRTEIEKQLNRRKFSTVVLAVKE